MDGWLCFTVEGAKTSCNWSGSLCLFICFALASVHDSQAGKPADPALAGVKSTSEHDCFPTWALIPRGRHCTQIHVLTVGAVTVLLVPLVLGQKAGLSNIYLFVVQSAD